MILFSLDKHTTPADFLSAQCARFTDRSANIQSSQVFAVAFSHNASYLPEQPQQELLAFVWLAVPCDSASSPCVGVSIFPAATEHLSAIEQLAAEPEAILVYCEAANLAHVRLDLPLLLEPIYIPKPWGQEIWYTGIEARGQAAVKGDGGSLPLPWVLEFLRPQLGLAATDNLILLKILDPLAEAPYGDLYFELHEQKQEVYVVTQIDKFAWPDGTGAIQLGFNPNLRNQYKDEASFKAAYLTAVNNYQQVRREIDARLDEYRQQAGIALDQPVSPQQTKHWLDALAKLPQGAALIEHEIAAKEAMDAFIALHPLQPGDVVAVPRFVPHALQHGVQVVEFQTPVYERKILSFGQKVLTQSHWDTEAALALVDMHAEAFLPPEQLENSAYIKRQRIVNFAEFEVERIALTGDELSIPSSLRYELNVARYGLLMVLEGEVELGEHTRLKAGDVVLLPSCAKPIQVFSKHALLLWAKPR